MSAPTPADVQGGRVVRLLTRHRTWTSPVLTYDEAVFLAGGLIAEAGGIGDGPAMVFFLCSDGRECSIRARELVSIEHQACTEAPVRPVPAVRTAEEIANSLVRL